MTWIPAGLRQRLVKFTSNPRLMTGALLASILLATHAAVWLLPSVFEPLQAQGIDRLFRLRAQFGSLRPSYDGTVFFVPIDDESAEMRESFYLGRKDYGRLVENLSKAGIASQFLDIIFAAPESEEGDRELADGIRAAGNAFVGMAVGATSRETPPEIAAPSPEHEALLNRQRWHPQLQGSPDAILHASRYFMTFPQVANAARGIGFIDVVPDRDGVIRRVSLLVRDRDGFLPSLFLLVICEYLGVGPEDVLLEPGERLVLRGAQRPGSDEVRDIAIPIDDQGQMIVNFIGPWGSIETYPFSAIYVASDDRYEMEDLRAELEGRVAVVSWFSTGRGDVGAVPTDPVYPRAGIWANAMNMILTGEFLRQFSGLQMFFLVELPLLVLLFFAATRLSTIPYVLSAVALFLAYHAVVIVSFLAANLILNVPAPLMVLIAATPVVAAYQYHLESEARAKMHRELAVAREIQMDTLPKEMPQVEGYDLAGHSVPADETGGDSFDVISLPDGKLMLLLGDATGHGIGPALSVTQVRAMLRVAVRLGSSLDDAVTHINDQLAQDLASNRFVTAFLGVVDTHGHRVHHHSAGQGPLLHFHAATGECEWFGSSRMALGVFAGLPSKPAKSLDLAPGDILGLMTDGVFEQENRAQEQFGEERVAELVGKYKDRPMTELMEALFAGVRAHRGAIGQTDDVTVLLVRRLPQT